MLQWIETVLEWQREREARKSIDETGANRARYGRAHVERGGVSCEMWDQVVQGRKWSGTKHKSGLIRLPAVLSARLVVAGWYCARRPEIKHTVYTHARRESTTETGSACLNIERVRDLLASGRAVDDRPRRFGRSSFSLPSTWRESRARVRACARAREKPSGPFTDGMKK